MKTFDKHIRLFILIILILLNAFVWVLVFGKENRALRIVFLDVGQGDAIFIEAPNGNQVLLDGGANRGVLKAMSEYVSFFDGFIDVVIASHPDKDHIGGLPSVLNKYNVGVFIETGVENETAVNRELSAIIENKNIDVVVARKGQRIILDKDVYIDILFPDRDVSGWNTNDASIVARLVYGEYSFLLMGDSPIKMEKYLVSIIGDSLQSDVLKLGHHGSRTSSSELFLSVVSPKAGIISVGEKNRYGHPHKEVLETLENLNIEVLSTAIVGDVLFETNGKILNIEY